MTQCYAPHSPLTGLSIDVGRIVSSPFHNKNRLYFVLLGQNTGGFSQFYTSMLSSGMLTGAAPSAAI